jgi:hypothetical protein
MDSRPPEAHGPLIFSKHLLDNNVLSNLSLDNYALSKKNPFNNNLLFNKEYLLDNVPLLNNKRFLDNDPLSKINILFKEDKLTINKDKEGSKYSRGNIDIKLQGLIK